MRIGSLFSGIGGLELGLEWSGLGHTVWQVELSPFCRSVLARHWPQVERFTDVRAVGKHNLTPVDLICGGFPCQDLSSAGKRAGLSGARSGLWYEYRRIVSEVWPTWVVVENVASGAKNWVDQVRSDLEQLGYESLPIPLSAFDVGAPHLRERVFIVAHSQQQQLREQPGGRGGENGQETPGPAQSGTPGASRNPYYYCQSTLPQHGEVARLRGMAGHSSHWTAPPEFCRMDDGVPDRVDRNSALGNAVVPQCAEVVGHVIQMLVGASR